MRSPAVGLDFGTTNSSVAVASASGVVDLVRFGDGSASFRSLLYLEQARGALEQARGAGRSVIRSFTGPAAIERYLQRESGEEASGRLIQSLKSYLAVRTLGGTEIFGRRYSVEELIARILGDLRAAASQHVGEPVTRATVGRPVRFVSSESDADDAYALERLSTALRLAGFTEIEFLPEPVAAAYTYEATLSRDELILIGDFGGGTSDFTLIRVGPGARQMASAERILGSAGVGLAGDALDARLIRHLVAPALGAGATVPSFGKPLPAVPAWIFANLERWHYLSFLRTRNVEGILSAARMRAAADPQLKRQIDALITLVDEDLGYMLHRSVQETKVALSDATTAEFRFRQAGIPLRRSVTRSEFEEWIRPELASIAATIDGLLRSTGVVAAAVDRVFLTGGTSFVPSVRTLFEDRFGAERVVVGEAFTSVARGLAHFTQQNGGSALAAAR